MSADPAPPVRGALAGVGGTPRVLVLAPAAEFYAIHLRVQFPQLEVYHAPSAEEAENALAEVEILIAFELPPEAAARMPKLRWVQCLISGTDHLSMALAGRDVLVTSTSGMHGAQMSEMALLHMLVLSRSAIDMIDSKRRHKWTQHDQHLLDGKTIGIVGLGTGGRRLGLLCHALGMTVCGFSRTVEAAPGFANVFARRDLLAHARVLDFLVLVTPYERDTHRIVDARLLANLKPTAFVINVSRGALVDQGALIAALHSGAIAGAGLDVTEPEPLPADSPLWDLANVFLTFHQAGQSDRYAEQALGVVVPNIRRYLQGTLQEAANG